MGFTFDDADKKGVASPLAEMRRLIDSNPRNREVIFPYIGGEEVNTSPTHTHHRYVIDFRDYPLLRRKNVGGSWSDAGEDRRREWLRTGIVPPDYPGPVAADWPDLLGIVERRVKPERDKLTRNQIGRKRAEFWWRYGSTAKDLYAKVAGLERVLAVSRVGQHASITFLPRRMVYAETVIVFPFQTFAAFCVLQSRPHEIWARFFGSSMKDDLRYTPSDCFETFPFPEGWDTDGSLEAAGRSYYEFRGTLMVEQGQGMTKTYNRFHDIYETDSPIVELRRLHAAMERAVLDAYGWTDTPTDCDFLLDYEIEEATWGRKKKPYRYRWPDTVRDEVLARLLVLNVERAATEARGGVNPRVPTSKPETASHGTTAHRLAREVAESRPLYGSSDG